MKCPHCLIAFHESWTTLPLVSGEAALQDARGLWFSKVTQCPACKHCSIVLLVRRGSSITEIRVYPSGTSRPPLSPAVPAAFAADYREACLVWESSAKASAALSRRCLQHLLREKAGTKKKDLNDQIDEVLSSRTLPSDLADMIDAIRVVGNFAAHPIKSVSTGEIVEVEPGEAELLLDTLEELFDYYFVRPVERSAKREALNKKLSDAGKPPLKG